jgi:hypothetical protein
VSAASIDESRCMLWEEDVERSDASTCASIGGFVHRGQKRVDGTAEHASDHAPLEYAPEPQLCGATTESLLCSLRRGRSRTIARGVSFLHHTGKAYIHTGNIGQRKTRSPSRLPTGSGHGE